MTSVNEVHLAHTRDYLFVSWAAGVSSLFPGFNVHWKRRRRQLDHPGFPRAYLLDLHHIVGHPRRRKFNCRLRISQGGGVAYSPWLDGAFFDPACRGIHRLRKTVALSDCIQSTTNFDGEPKAQLRFRRLHVMNSRQPACESRRTPDQTLRSLERFPASMTLGSR